MAEWKDRYRHMNAHVKFTRKHIWSNSRWADESKDELKKKKKKLNELLILRKPQMSLINSSSAWRVDQITPRVWEKLINSSRSFWLQTVLLNVL